MRRDRPSEPTAYPRIVTLARDLAAAGDNSASPVFVMVIGILGVGMGAMFIKAADLGVENANRWRLAGRPAGANARWGFVIAGWVFIAVSLFFFFLGLARELG